MQRCDHINVMTIRFDVSEAYTPTNALLYKIKY